MKSTSFGKPPERLAAFRRRFPSQRILLSPGANSEWRAIEAGGDKRCIVLLPGAGGTAEVYINQIVALADEFRVIALTYPHHDRIEPYADELAAVLDRLSVRECVIYGNSLGGIIAQAFVARRPANVRKALLSNTLFLPSGMPATSFVMRMMPANAIWRRLRKVASGWPENTAEEKFAKQMIAVQLQDHLSPGAVKSRLLAAARPTISAKPFGPENLCVIDCEDDISVRPAQRAQVRREYARSRLRTLKHGGHVPYLVNPPAINAIIKEECELPF